MNRRLLAGEYLVLGEHPDSFDSRYFGPLPQADLVAKLRKL
jgi:type IV secretory pathway protease TraF